MGLMTQILQSEPKKIAQAAKIEKPAAGPVAEKTACEKCGCPDLWESIYADGVLRCDLCEPAPTPSIVGRRVGLAAESLELAEQPGHDDMPLYADPADRYVEFTSKDGITGFVLRGYDNPRSANYNQRVCAYVSIGVAEYERCLDALQEEWREEIFGAERLQKR